MVIKSTPPREPRVLRIQEWKSIIVYFQVIHSFIHSILRKRMSTPFGSNTVLGAVDVKRKKIKLLSWRSLQYIVQKVDKKTVNYQILPVTFFPCSVIGHSIQPSAQPRILGSLTKTVSHNPHPNRQQIPLSFQKNILKKNPTSSNYIHDCQHGLSLYYLL